MCPAQLITKFQGEKKGILRTLKNGKASKVYKAAANIPGTKIQVELYMARPIATAKTVFTVVPLARYTDE